jgi:hypothetical protein
MVSVNFIKLDKIHVLSSQFLSEKVWYTSLKYEWLLEHF